jgi:hypothetical protein
MKILKRIIFLFLLIFASAVLIIPGAVWWILTGKDIVSPIMDRIVTKLIDL